MSSWSPRYYCPYDVCTYNKCYILKENIVIRDFIYKTKFANEKNLVSNFLQSSYLEKLYKIMKKCYKTYQRSSPSTSNDSQSIFLNLSHLSSAVMMKRRCMLVFHTNFLFKTHILSFDILSSINHCPYFVNLITFIDFQVKFYSKWIKFLKP